MIELIKNEPAYMKSSMCDSTFIPKTWNGWEEFEKK